MRYRIKDSVAYQYYFERLYIFDDYNREAYVLADTSMLIWKLLEKNTSYDEIFNELQCRYNIIEMEVLKKDLNEFLIDLVKADLVEQYD